ncbi:MAG: DUF2752 domain-containing protein [Cyanobacteria bacterium P01_F01_bin.86]
MSAQYLSSDSSPLRFPLIRYGTIAAFSFPIVDAFLIAFAGFDYPLSKCQFQATFGFPAPSCGLSRSFVAFVSGDWVSALQYHLFGPVFFLMFCSIIVVSLTELRLKRSLMEFYAYLFDYRVTLSLFFLMLAYYGLRLYARYAVVATPWGIDQTALWQFLKVGAESL